MIKGVSAAERLMEEEGSGRMSEISVSYYSIRGEMAQTVNNLKQVA